MIEPVDVRAETSWAVEAEDSLLQMSHSEVEIVLAPVDAEHVSELLPAVRCDCQGL